MGKIDDMRKHREALFAQRERAANPGASDGASDPDQSPVEAAPEADVLPIVRSAGRRTSAAGRGAAAAEGACSVCGKVRPLQNGVVPVHQKGLGKVCAGSRKEPR